MTPASALLYIKSYLIYRFYLPYRKILLFFNKNSGLFTKLNYTSMNLTKFILLSEFNLSVMAKLSWFRLKQNGKITHVQLSMPLSSLISVPSQC